jgi:hypothetical protein
MQTKTGEQNATGLGYERVPQPKKQNRPHRVELVIARIFAKQRAYTKQESFRRFVVEDVEPSWD